MLGTVGKLLRPRTGGAWGCFRNSSSFACRAAEFLRKYSRLLASATFFATLLQYEGFSAPGLKGMMAAGSRIPAGAGNGGPPCPPPLVGL